MKNRKIKYLIALLVAATVTTNLTVPIVKAEENPTEKSIVETAEKNVSGKVPVEAWDGHQGLIEEVTSKTGVAKIEDVTYEDLKSVKMLDFYIGYQGKVPEIIGKFEGLVALYIKGEGLKEIPECIGNLKGLKEVDFSGTNITKIPNSFSNLKELEFIYLNNTGINEIPSLIFDLANLNTLELEYTMINNIPADISKLAKLESLKLRGTQINSLPPEIYSLKSLRYVDLSETGFTEIPKEFGSMEKLEQLEFEECSLIEVPNEITNIKGDKLDFTLNIRDNQVTNIPKLDKQKVLKDNNFLSNIQYGIELGKQLTLESNLYRINKGQVISKDERLALVKCVGLSRYGKIVETPINTAHDIEFILDDKVLTAEDLAKLEEGNYKLGVKLKNAPIDNLCTQTEGKIDLVIGNGEHGNLEESKIKDKYDPSKTSGKVPVELWLNNKALMFQVCVELEISNIKDVTFEDLAKINELYLLANNISDLPNVLQEFKNLKVLNISNNNFTEIPIEVYSMKNLERLEIANNPGITELSARLTEMASLRGLIADYCNISKIDESIAGSDLTYIYLDGNKGVIPYLEILYNIDTLNVLSLCDTNLVSLGDNIKKLSNLTALYVANNQLLEIPELVNKDIEYDTSANIMYGESYFGPSDPKQVFLKWDLVKDGISIKKGEVFKQDYLRSLLECNYYGEKEEIYKGHDIDFIIDGKVVSPQEFSKFAPGSYNVTFKLKLANKDNQFGKTSETVKIDISE